MNRYQKPKKKRDTPFQVKREVWQRDSYTCQMCGRTAPPEYSSGYRIAWHPHHIHHRSQGGKDVVGNLVTLCDWCHIPLAHKFIWLDERMPKHPFMGRLYFHIYPTNSKGITITDGISYEPAHLCLAKWRVWERERGIR